MPWRRIPFDPLVDFDSLREKDVLEIGVGSGIHAQLLARCARSFTGIDLTEYAVRSTKGRLQYLGLPERILQMDAEHLEFPGGSFDFVWTWGVIHHASDTSRVLQEMHRVIRPGGRAITMVYHRSFWNYYILSGFCRGILMGDFLKSRSLHKTVQRWTDGALARFYTIPEWIALVSKYFSVEQVLVYGNKSEIIPLPAGGLKNAILRILPDQAGRFLTNDCQWGSFLVSILRKA